MGGSIFEESKRIGRVYIGRKMRVGWGGRGIFEVNKRMKNVSGGGYI